MDLKRVVVTGIGAITPIGNSAPEFWNALLAGKSGAGRITLFNPEKFKTKFACEVKDFDANELLGRKEARRLDRFAQFALVSTDEAIADSGLKDSAYNPDRIGVIYASGIGGIRTFEDEIIEFANGDGTPRFSPFFIPKMILDIAAGQISIRHGFRGINYATVSACASSSHAMIDAFNYIRMGKADAIITGGAESTITQGGVGGFNSMKALSERNDSPETASRPFDKDRDGFVLGEGGGSLVFEEYEYAKARGAKIYAEIVGGGMSADAYHITAPHPEGLGAINVIKNALSDAEMNPEDIDYINVHGTSTPLGDLAEVKAIMKVYGDHVFNLNISSTKSMTGHTLGAAGGIELIACIFAVREGIIPPTINHFTDDPAFPEGLNFTFNEPQEREVRAALSNTFGFGGHNASLIVKKFEE